MGTNVKPSTVDIDAARDKVLAIESAICTFLPERDESVHMMLCAVIIGEHTCIIGPPGTGKSMLSNTIAQCFEPGVEYVSRLLHKAMTPDELFGAIDLAQFQTNKVYRRNLVGGIAMAHFVFLDEIWKGNTLSLNANLTLLNERTYSEQGIVHNSPLWSCFSASNEFPSDDSLAALWDRFLFRHIVDYIQDDRAWEDLLFAKSNGTLDSFKAPALLTMNELKAIKVSVRKVRIDRAMLRKLRDLKKQLAQEGIVISDRRAVKVLDALKASAWLDGEDVVTVDDFQILRFCLWDTPPEREKVLTALATLERSATAKVIDQIDEALRAYAARPQEQAAYYEAIPGLMNKLATVGRSVKERISAGEFSKRGTEKVTRRARELGGAFKQLKDDFSAGTEGF